MKKIVLIQKMLLLGLFSLILNSNLVAQLQNSASKNSDFYRNSQDYEGYKSNLSISVGPNLFQLANRLDNLLKNNIPQTDSLKYGSFSNSGQPTLQIAYDYSINQQFSLGFAYSRNALFFNLNDLKFTAPVENASFEGDASLRLARNTFTIRPLFHYGQSEKFDFYSGLRVGLTVWTTLLKGDFTATASEELQKNFNGKLGRAAFFWPNIGATLFGVRYYPIPNVGVGAEFNVGAPYPLAASVNFRF